MSAARLPLYPSTDASEVVVTTMLLLVAAGVTSTELRRCHGHGGYGPAATGSTPGVSELEREVFGIHVVDEVAELLDHLLRLFLVGLLDTPGLLQHLFLGIDRRADADRQGDRVRGPARHRAHLTLAAEDDLGEERALAELGDGDAFDLGPDLVEQVLHEVVRHRAGGLDVLHGQGDRLRLGHPDEDRQDPTLPRHLAQDDDRRTRWTLRRLDADEFHLDGHRSPPYSSAGGIRRPSGGSLRWVRIRPEAPARAVHRASAGRGAPARRSSPGPSGGPRGSAA